MMMPQTLIQKKQQGEKISMITCYDATFAKLVTQSDIDCILVGDSVSMVVHGFESTVHATMDMMILHTQAVRRGAPDALIVGDLPFFSMQVSDTDMMSNVKALMQAGASCVKCEGADADTLRKIKMVTEAGVSVMGHIGLTPQSVHKLGGHTLQGKTEAAQEALFEQALRLEEAGCFAVVLECVPETVGKRISEALTIPTIGIGAGRFTDGQVLVLYDMLGLSGDFSPKFLRRFGQGHRDVLSALQHYHNDVRSSAYPSATETYRPLTEEVTP